MIAAGEITETGRISLVGAGPGARDLITLRGAERLRMADVVYYDRLVDPAMLDLVGPKAERVFVGKLPGAHAWPQGEIDAVIVAAARRGLHVVRLKSGDPSVFGRATEELKAARAAGIAVDIVPGVTAASAAAACLGRALTERGETDRLVIATGTCRDGDAAPDWADMLAPGVTLALYMAVGRIEALARRLGAAGFAPHWPVEIVCAASTSAECVIRTDIDGMVAAAARGEVRNPAILFLRRTKSEHGRSALPMAAE